MSLRVLPWVVGLAAVLQTGVVCAESTDWLMRMAQAVRMQNYEGVMVYARDEHMESMRIVHRYRDGHEQERLQALSGDAREIYRDRDVVTCILPKDHAVKLDRPAFRGLLPALNRATVDQIGAHYETQELGSARLLGRVCRAVSIRPRDAYRYGYRMWIDEQTSLPLKVELLGSDGEALEQVMFTQISYPATIEDNALESGVDTKDFVWIRHRALTAAAPEGSRSWNAGQLPPGFRMVVH
ncbi:MAG: sigma-E factor regulatory protein RseB domain-containing protein, partial [Nevskiales bacterium]